MNVKDIHVLMEQFFSDGFTADNLSKITGVSSKIIMRCTNAETLSQREIMDMGTVLDLLGFLYMTDTNNLHYLKDCVASLEQYFSLPHIAIANYLGLNEPELDRFLESPESYNNGYKLSMKLMHLRTVLLQRWEKI